MHILALVRNYIPAYKQVLDGRWDIVEIAANAHDLEGKTVGVVGTGRIGQRVCTRPIDRDYLIVANGRVVSPSYSYAFKV